MPGTGDLSAAHELLDAYGADSALVRLAELVSPACRIEPQLLRQVRLACLPGADAALEQALWFSDLIASRTDVAVTFMVDVGHALRGRLKRRLPAERALVSRAREVAAQVHCALAPVLLLEDELAWAAVFDEHDRIADSAQTIARSLASHREGLDHWLGRAWSALPDEIEDTDEGPVLAQVAAARGARVETDRTPQASELASVAHLLGTVPLLLRRDGARLALNAAREDATHVLDVPATRPLLLELRFSRGRARRSTRVEIDPSSVLEVQVGRGQVTLVTVAGDEYALEPQDGGSRGLAIEMLPAHDGTSLLITWEAEEREHVMLVDAGTRATGRLLAQRLRDDLRDDPHHEGLDLMVITHIDADRIAGAIELLERAAEDEDDGRPVFAVREVWMNTVDEALP